MNSFVLVSFLVSCAYGAQLSSYLPPRPGVGAGGGFVSPPTYTGAGAGGGVGGGAGGFAPSGPVIPIVSYQNNPNQGDGQYSYSYQTGNGINAEESGRGGPGPQDGTSAHGSYSYTGPDGQTYTITYTADANGFVPQGAHLPTPPPIPEEILKSLQFNAANPQSEYDTGDYSGAGAGAGAGAGGYRPSFQGGRPAPSYNPSSGYHYRK
nr:endocuticle structural glycoprotein SgAbd-4-like [Halyomorpha halys]